MTLKKYIFWMAVNSASVSCSSVLSTSSVLSSVFGSSVTQAGITSTYIGKDILGQLGGLAFTWNVNRKTPIVRTALIQQASLYLENLSIYLTGKNSVLALLGISNTMKNISFIALGAVNAQNLRSLAESEEVDIGTLYARVAAVNTLASTLGMLGGIALLHLVPSHTTRTLFLLPPLTVLNVYALHRAVLEARS